MGDWAVMSIRGGSSNVELQAETRQIAQPGCGLPVTPGTSVERRAVNWAGREKTHASVCHFTTKKRATLIEKDGPRAAACSRSGPASTPDYERPSIARHCDDPLLRVAVGP
jgi:hypothetical protein